MLTREQRITAAKVLRSAAAGRVDVLAIADTIASDAEAEEYAAMDRAVVALECIRVILEDQRSDAPESFAARIVAVLGT